MKVKGNKVYFEVKDYHLAKELLRKFIVIHADATGPFGEDEGAVVIGMNVDYADNIDNYEGLEGKDWDELDDEEQSWFDDENDYEQLNPYLADGIVCTDKDLGQSGVNWCDWEMIYADLWIEKEDYDTVNNVHEVEYDMEVESTKHSINGMLLEEAKEILKKNGYRLVEAYDAVTDKNNIKNKRSINQSYFTHVMKRLKNALEEEGIDSKVTNYSALSFDKYKVTLYDTEEEYDDVKEWGKNYDGAESGDDASYSQMETKVVLRLWFRGELVDEAKFDPRNTPGMVKWIIKWAFTNIEG